MTDLSAGNKQYFVTIVFVEPNNGAYFPLCDDAT